MVSTPAQKILCPVCHQADQVKTVPAAYESGVTRLAPPTMPVARVPMMPTILVGCALVSVGSFFILIWSGTGGYGGWPIAVQVVQVVLTIVAIVAALVISFITFQRVVGGDMKSQRYLPAYDEAMENWRHLYYCKREDVVFNPQTNKTISDAALNSLLSVETNYERLEQSHPAAVSHQ